MFASITDVPVTEVDYLARNIIHVNPLSFFITTIVVKVG